MGAPQVREFLSWLANERNVASSTQDQALSALVFLYASVLRRPIKSLEGIARAKKPQRLPVVLDEAEILAILDELQGEYWLLVGLLYGSGLRLMESLRLRIKDLDFSQAGVLPHVQTLLRDASVSGRGRYPYGAGTAGPQ